MTLLEIIQTKYPDAQEDDFAIVQDGTELRLEHWDVRQDGHFTKRPTEQELRTWIDAVEQQQIRDAARGQSLQRVAALITRGLVGRHISQLTDAELHRLERAEHMLSGKLDPSGTVRPVEQWPSYQEETGL